MINIICLQLLMINENEYNNEDLQSWSEFKEYRLTHPAVVVVNQVEVEDDQNEVEEEDEGRRLSLSYWPR